MSPRSVTATEASCTEGVSRIPHHHAPPLRPVAGGAIAVAFLGLAVAGCTASSSSATASAVLGTQVQQDCTAVSDVLANGPDPDADAAGYAQAQVLPLRQLKIGDAALRGDVLTLAGAFQAFSAGSGSAAAVTKAENSVNSVCPQAAP
jgi:hypothetical protein